MDTKVPTPEKGTLQYIVWVMLGQTKAFTETAVPFKYFLIEIFRMWLEDVPPDNLQFIREDYIGVSYYYESIGYKCVIKERNTNKHPPQYVIQLFHRKYQAMYQEYLSDEEYRKLKSMAIEKVR